MRLQVGDDGRRESGRVRVERLRRPRDPLDAHALRDRAGQALNPMRREPEPVVGERAGAGRRRLGDVEPVHLPRPRAVEILLGLAAGGEVAGVAEPRGPDRHEVGVECGDHVGPVEAVDGLDVLAEREDRAGPRIVASDGVILIPLRPGELLAKRLELLDQGRRRDDLRQHPEPGAAVGPVGVANPEDVGEEVVPGADPGIAGDDLRAVGVVEPEDRGLHEDVGPAPVGRMIGVAFDLRRSPRPALDEHARRVAAERQGRGEEEGLAVDVLLGRLHGRHDRLGRLEGAPRDARQGQRGPHQLEEAATSDLVGPDLGLAGELAGEILLELLGPGQLFEAPPELRPPGPGQPPADRGQVGRPVVVPVMVVVVGHR